MSHLGPFIRERTAKDPPMLVVQIQNTLHYIPLEPHDLTRITRQAAKQIDCDEQDWRRYAKPPRLSE